MPRATWSGTISFGLVNVPVKLYSATRPQDVHFHQLEESTGARIRYQKVSDKTGQEVDADDIVKGYEISSGRYVTFTDAELDELQPEGTRTIDIEEFVDLDQIDPIYFERPYWAAPDGQAAEKAYALLAKAMEDKQQVAIGRFVMRTKQYLAAIRPVDGALTIETMLFPDEVVPADSIPELPVKAKVTPKELKAAEQLIESLKADWKPEEFRDTYRDELLDRIERKAKGEEIVEEPGAEQTAQVLDLMEALEASVKARKSGERATPSGASTTKTSTKSAGTSSNGSGAGSKAKRSTSKRAASKRPAAAKRTASKRTASKRKSA
ncbi:MAG: putative end-binding protein Ku [Acidimicrobiales bacterium]|nr:putative end-binding protein Ku [Acidimicrobiales bacterium]